MSPRENPLHLSFPAGTWFGTEVRVSWFLPIIGAACVISLGQQYGLTVFGILVASVLLHEIGHVVTARQTGGHGDEILLWPLGGLAMVRPARSLKSRVLTSLAGPLMNLVVCAIVFPHVLNAEHGNLAWNPLVLPFTQEEFGKNLFSQVLVVTFQMNWALLLLNLLPLIPLDGGRVFETLAIHSAGRSRGTDLTWKVGLWTVVVMCVVSWYFDASWLMGLMFVLGMMVILETQRVVLGEIYDAARTGFGEFDPEEYDDEDDDAPAPPRQSLLQRWKARREAERRKRELELELEVESQLDTILAKLHEQGMNSLTETERRILDRASEKFRTRDKAED